MFYTVIRDNFGEISIILPNQLSNTNLLVVFLAIIMSASTKTNFSAVNSNGSQLCIFTFKSV